MQDFIYILDPISSNNRLISLTDVIRRTSNLLVTKDITYFGSTLKDSSFLLHFTESTKKLVF